jgi:hypothetical protein
MQIEIKLETEMEMEIERWRKIDEIKIEVNRFRARLLYIVSSRNIYLHVWSPLVSFIFGVFCCVRVVLE